MEINRHLTDFRLLCFGDGYEEGLSEQNKAVIYDEDNRDTLVPNIIKLVSSNVPLTELELSDISITDDQVSSFASGLAKNTKLKELQLYNNNINNQGIIALAQALEVNTTLSILTLGANAVGGDSAKAIAAMLTKNLFLKSVSIGGYNTADIIESLYTNHSITNLFIDYSPGCEKLLSSKLCKLKLLSSTKYDPSKFDSIFEALRDNTTLHNLYLSFNSNHVPKEFWAKLAVLLKGNKYLQAVSVLSDSVQDRSPPYDEGLEALYKTLQTNCYFHYLEGINHEGIDGIIKRNQDLHESAVLYLLQDKVNFYSNVELKGNLTIIKYFKYFSDSQLVYHFDSHGLRNNFERKILEAYHNNPKLVAALKHERALLDSSEQSIRLCLTPKFFHKHFFELIRVCHKIQPDKELANGEKHISHLPKDMINYIISYIAITDMPSIGEFVLAEAEHMWDGVW